VTLSDTNVGDDFVSRLKAAKRLERLWIDNTSVTDEGLRALEGITTLRRLSLLGTQTGDLGLAAFKACRQLEALKPGRNVTDKGLQQFETLENVRILELNGQITGNAFRDFSLPKADTVYLVNCAVGDDDLPPLVRAIRDVRVLLIEGCPVTDAGLQHLKQLGKTQILLLSKTQIRGRALRHLTALSGLQILEIRGSPLDDPDLESLEPLYTGAAPGGNLTLNQSTVSSPDLAKISGLANLLSLDLAHTEITDQGLSHLYALKKLLRVDLRGTQVTAEGVGKLQQAIRGLKIAWDKNPRP
jgi:hypothetical protein